MVPCEIAFVCPDRTRTSGSAIVVANPNEMPSLLLKVANLVETSGPDESSHWQYSISIPMKKSIMPLTAMRHPIRNGETMQQAPSPK